ncbi:SEC-C metal-binding domain-containing protein [Clostridium tertium]|uniref:SEC-C metal-binding domain-containing protein n=1 Tax=Clostridium tertium TaxID=1559 RepID=UPI001C1E1615|nr:SEC-C metal-binding domain-containing protein [Clostridium tertium]MBU6134020.1 SEC-C domain-containing protein [Clostridium tertium]
MNNKKQANNEIIQNDKKPEEVLEELKKLQLISDDEYNIIHSKFEDMNDQLNLSHEDIYKKAYKNRRVEKCVEEIINMKYDYGVNFRKVFLISDCLKNPLGFNYKEEDYNLTVNILLNTIKYAKENEYEEEFIKELQQFVLLTDILYKNNKTNSKRLNDNKFSEYSLSEQLRMICIFIQDQSRIMRQKLRNDMKENKFFTGVELIVADKPVDYYENTKVSLADNYEGLLEYFDTLIRFLYVTKKKEVRVDDTEKHGDIHPYNIPSFEEVICVAQQRVMYLRSELKFRYSNWEIKINSMENTEKIAIFESKYKEKYQAHIVAGIRRRYRIITENLQNNTTDKVKSAIEAIDKLADKIDVNNIQKYVLNKELYSKAKLYVEGLILAYKKTTKPFYLQCKFNDITVTDIINAFEYLYIISNIYITAVYKKFNEKEYCDYKYLVPVIKINIIISEFAEIYNLEFDYAKRVIYCFVFDESIRNDDGDIFSRPLIKVSKDKVLFCESLIEQLNLERCIEMLLLKNKIDLAPMGKEFEDKLIGKLSTVPGIQVNTKPILFRAYDDKDVEFDFIGTLEDHLLLFEFKSITTPYDEKHLYKNEKTIKEGVEQVLRRCKIVQHDWDKIKKFANIDLPDEPYSEDKIIKVVCTNIFDFTTLKYDDVRITDESTLLKYFTSPYVGVFSMQNEMEVVNAKKIWKKDMPTIDEFIDYLDNPVTVDCIPECLKEEYKIIPYFDGEFPIAFIDLEVSEDPYSKMIEKNICLSKVKAVGRNEKCPCGSGIKYKRCCGR